MHTVSVPHGPDGSVLRRPFPCRSHTTSFHWTDGGRNGLGPFRHVTMLLSRPLDGHLRTFLWKFQLRLKVPNMIISIPLCSRFPPAFFNPSSPQDRLHTIHRLSVLNAGFLAASTCCTRSICCQRHFLVASRVFLRCSRTVLLLILVSMQPQESRMSFNLKISKILIKRTDFELDR